MRMRPGYGALESMPPDTDSPKPRGPLIISTVNVQSETIKRKKVFVNLWCRSSVERRENWKSFPGEAITSIQAKSMLCVHSLSCRSTFLSMLCVVPFGRKASLSDAHKERKEIKN